MLLGMSENILHLHEGGILFHNVVIFLNFVTKLLISREFPRDLVGHDSTEDKNVQRVVHIGFGEGNGFFHKCRTGATPTYYGALWCFLQ